MNRTELIAQVASKTGLSKRDAGIAVGAVFEAVEEAVCNREKVCIKGFGSFEARVKKPRKARNPITKEEIELSETVIPVFKAGDRFKKTVCDMTEERISK